MSTLLQEMAEEKAFWATIKANPIDVLPRQVFADWLDEHGRRSLAFALRWSATRRRYPKVSPGGRVASTKPQPPIRIVRSFPAPPPYVIPRAVFDQLRQPRPQNGLHKSKSVPEAFERLAEALSILRHVVGWEI